jgi:hypothetical protein
MSLCLTEGWLFANVWTQVGHVRRVFTRVYAKAGEKGGTPWEENLKNLGRTHYLGI